MYQLNRGLVCTYPIAVGVFELCVHLKKKPPALDPFPPSPVFHRPSYLRAQPLLAVISDGQVTALKVTDGLSAPMNLGSRICVRIWGVFNGTRPSKGWDEPVEAPVAASLERRREAVAVALGVDATVPVAPAVGGSTVLLGAGCWWSVCVSEVSSSALLCSATFCFVKKKGGSGASLATIELANTTAGHGNIKMVVPQVPARVRRLHNHLLA